MSGLEWFFTDYMTWGRWVMVWISGLIVAFCTTSGKPGVEGVLGGVYYIVATAGAFLLYLLYLLWQLAG